MTYPALPCIGAQFTTPLGVQGPQSAPSYTSPGSPVCPWPIIEINEPTVKQLMKGEPASLAVGAQTVPCGDDCYKVIWDFAFGFPRIGAQGPQGAQEYGFSIVSDVRCIDGALKVFKRDVLELSADIVVVGAEYYSHDAGCCDCPPGPQSPHAVGSQCCSDLIPAKLYSATNLSTTATVLCGCAQITNCSSIPFGAWYRCSFDFDYDEISGKWYTDVKLCEPGKTLQFVLYCDGTNCGTFFLDVLCNGVVKATAQARSGCSCSPFQLVFTVEIPNDPGCACSNTSFNMVIREL